MTDDEFLDFFRFYRDKRAGIDPASEKVSASDPETVQRTAEEELFSSATTGMVGVSSTGADSAPSPTATATNLAYPCSSASASESPAGSIMNGAKSPIYKSAVPVARKSENYELKADVESQDAAAMVPLAAEVDPPLSSSSLIGEGCLNTRMQCSPRFVCFFSPMLLFNQQTPSTLLSTITSKPQIREP